MTNKNELESESIWYKNVILSLSLSLILILARALSKHILTILNSDFLVSNGYDSLSE
jgi:hypothetical protein